MKKPPVSASLVEPNTCRKILYSVRIGPLGLTPEGLVGFL